MRKPKASPQRARFRKNVAKLRMRRKLTQENLAERVGANARYIQSLGAGEYFPSLPKLALLRSVFRCSWDALFAGCEKP